MSEEAFIAMYGGASAQGLPSAAEIELANLGTTEATTVEAGTSIASAMEIEAETAAALAPETGGLSVVAGGVAIAATAIGSAIYCIFEGC